MKMTPLSLGNIILLKEKGGMRESIPRQVDKKSQVPEEERGLWGSGGGNKGLKFSRRKGQTSFFFFLSTFLSLSYIKNFFFFKHRTDDYTTNNSV